MLIIVYATRFVGINRIYILFMKSLLHKLQGKLLDASTLNGEDLILETINRIHSLAECDMCTLWSINHNNTLSDSETGSFDSASLVVRLLKKGIIYPSYNRVDFSHPLPGSFTEKVFEKTKMDKVSYFHHSINDDILFCHKSRETLLEMGISYFFCIPICDDKRVTIALLILAYKAPPSFDPSFCSDIANVINKAVASVLSRHHLYQKQQILSDLMDNYSRGKTSLKDIFHPVINRIFRKYFDYEGASVFIWDSFDNRYNLLLSTGLQEDEDEVFYKVGEGLTGRAAVEKKAKIYDDIIHLEDDQIPPHIHKYREKTDARGETMLVVPILSTSNQEEVLGVIRFTNKINTQSRKGNKHILDFFNDNDIELIKNAFHYLALNVENYLAEEERKAFISKMSHEFNAPASAIRITAERALRKFKMNDTRFMRLMFPHYMESIIDYSNLQLMQATSNLFLTNLTKNKNPKLNIDKYSLKDIIKESVNIIRPIARDHEVMFNNIHVANDFPNITLNVDKEAFVMVFYNMLTNAIKYHDEDFEVNISAKETLESLIISISDKGIGILEADVSRIFNLGVRSENAKKMNAEGYGIGLHVVKLIINTFGGEITVSHKHNPTTFEIKLPRSLYA